MNGVGHHEWTLTAEEDTIWSQVKETSMRIVSKTDHILFLKASFARTILYTCAAPLIKLSLLLFYLRLFAPTRSFRFFSYAVAIFLLGWWLSFLVAETLQCTPKDHDVSLTSIYTGPCVNIQALDTSLLATNVLTDIIVLVMPCPIILKLKLPRRKKMQLLGIFMIGGLYVPQVFEY